jgi:hypothetical protein
MRFLDLFPNTWPKSQPTPDEAPHGAVCKDQPDLVDQRADDGKQFVSRRYAHLISNGALLRRPICLGRSRACPAIVLQLGVEGPPKV